MSPGFNLDDYEPVAARIARFWGEHPNGRISTAVVTSLSDKDHWVFVAQVYRDYADQYPASTGYAQEIVGEGMVNRNAALENCETSAIGRALANLGYSTSKRASREEMAKVSTHRLPAADGEDAVEPEGSGVPSSPPAPAEPVPDDPGEAWQALTAHLADHPDVRTLKDDIHQWVKSLYSLMVTTQLWPEDALQTALERDYPDMELWKGERHVSTLKKDEMLRFTDRSFLWAKQRIAQEQAQEAAEEFWPEEGTDESDQ